MSKTSKSLGFCVALVLALLPVTNLTAAGKEAKYESQGTTIRGNIYAPADSTQRAPGVVILHTAAGVSGHEESVGEKLAKAGYVSYVIQYTPKVSETIMRDSGALDRLYRTVLDGANYLKSQTNVDPSRIGVLGFSLGGYFATRLAVAPEESGVRAAVVYYGVFQSAQGVVDKLNTPVLAFQGERDKYEGLIKAAKAVQGLTREQGKPFELVLYPGAGHQFDFEHLKDRFDSNAAGDAWNRTIAFFNKHLK